MSTSYCPKCDAEQGFSPGVYAKCPWCGYEGSDFQHDPPPKEEGSMQTKGLWKAKRRSPHDLPS